MLNFFKLKQNRFLSLDIIRGICIILMILDHFVLMVLKVNLVEPGNTLFWLDLINFCKSVINNQFRKIIRYIVISCFFIVSGISCSLSKNNWKRGVKLTIMAILITVITYSISFFSDFNIRVEFGVIHFYAACVLIWYLINKIDLYGIQIICYAILIIASLIILVFTPTLSSSNILLPLGIPKEGYIYQFDYFPIFPWISIFLIGGLIGENYFKTKEAKENIIAERLFAPLIYVGQHGLGIYLIHLPLLIILIFIFKLI